MNISSASSVSGMNAANLRMDNAANNVANVNTPDFQARQGTEPAEAARPAQQPADVYESGTGAAAYAAAGTERSEPARDMADTVTNRNTYAANAETVRVQDRVQDEVANTTIDLVG